MDERVRVEKAIGTEISRGFEKKLTFREDVEVSVYLRKVAERLIEATPEFRGSAIGLFVIQEEPIWKNYSLPGARVYLAAGLLKKVDYENQLAAAIAIELGHLLQKNVLRRIGQNLDPVDAQTVPLPSIEKNRLENLILPEPGELRAVDYFGPRGVFNFTHEAQFAAVSDAVGILYRAGYDPRGLTALFELFRSRPENSPYEANFLEKLIQKTRRVIAENAPLRNPVIRSTEFLEIQKRIKKL